MIRVKLEAGLRSRPRDWAWPWTRGWGPLTLSLRLEAEVEALTGLRARGPCALEREGRYRSRADVERGELALVAPGSLQLVRSFHEPPPRVAGFDARLLSRLAGGVLGPLRWDLIDEEYVEPLAGGTTRPRSPGTCRPCPRRRRSALSTRGASRPGCSTLLT